MREASGKECVLEKEREPGYLELTQNSFESAVGSSNWSWLIELWSVVDNLLEYDLYWNDDIYLSYGL